MKFLVDMNLSPGWVAFLAGAGFESVHWSTVGAVDASDVQLMRWAVEHGCIVLTNDLEFGAILAATQRQGPSVVQIRSDLLTPSSIGNAILNAIRQAERDLAKGAILSIDPARARLRLLPLID